MLKQAETGTQLCHHISLSYLLQYIVEYLQGEGDSLTSRKPHIIMVDNQTAHKWSQALETEGYLSFSSHKPNTVITISRLI